MCLKKGSPTSAHFSWARLAALLSRANSGFGSKPPAISAIRATLAEYKVAAFRYADSRRSFSSQQRSFMLLRPFGLMWRHPYLKRSVAVRPQQTRTACESGGGILPTRLLDNR